MLKTSKFIINETANNEFAQYFSEHGEGLLVNTTDMDWQPISFSGVRVSIEPTANGPITYVKFLNAEGFMSQDKETFVDDDLELISPPTSSETVPGYLLNSSDGLFIAVKDSFFKELRGDGEQPFNKKIPQIVEDLSWAVASHICQANPELAIQHTHPGGGLYDCLTILGPELHIDINRTGSIHFHVTKSREQSPIPMGSWQLQLIHGTDPKIFARRICELAGLPFTSPRPKTTPHTLTYRVISNLLQENTSHRKTTRATTQFIDTAGPFGSDGGRAEFPEMLAIPANQIWVIKEENSTIAWLWEGWGWNRLGERHDLYAAYRKGQSIIEIVNWLTLPESEYRSPELPKFTAEISQPRYVPYSFR